VCRGGGDAGRGGDECADIWAVGARPPAGCGVPGEAVDRLWAVWERDEEA